jgi:hypothetical protein
VSANGRDRGYITWRPTSRICAKLNAVLDVLAIRERFDLDQLAETRQRSAAIRADFEARLRSAGLWGEP